jgi:hypothetical protein
MFYVLIILNVLTTNPIEERRGQVWIISFPTSLAKALQIIQKVDKILPLI